MDDEKAIRSERERCARIVDDHLQCVISNDVFSALLRRISNQIRSGEPIPNPPDDRFFDSIPPDADDF